MKKVHYLLLFIILCFQVNFLEAKSSSITLDTIIQDYHFSDKVKATKTQALIRMKVTDFRKTKLENIPVWVHDKKGQYWHGTTDKNGEVFFLLPNNHQYQTNIDQEVDYRKFNIPKTSNYFKTVKVVLMTSKIKEVVQNDTVFQDLAAGVMPTGSRVLVKIKISNLEGQALKDEVLYYESKKTKKIYLAKTNHKGQSALMLPKGDTYCIHSYAFRDITCKTFENSNTSRISRFEFNTISSAEFRQRALERQILLARRDSIQRVYRLRDSMQLARNQYQNFYLQHRYKDRDFNTIEQNIKTVALKDQEALLSNENYYAEIGDEIKTILHRNKDQWKQKRIVANIDCSMYKYIDELMVWNYSNKKEQEGNTYWLFNGFNYNDNEEDQTHRRGIFQVKSNNVEGFFNTIDKIVNFSCRGSRLENVVEALVLSAKGKSAEEDLLFIADNYSDVKDLHKLKELRVPVHVLLTASQFGLNENYLEIAYHSGGSIHTNDIDINSAQLKALNNGDRLSIGKHSYTFYKGKFLKVS